MTWLAVTFALASAALTALSTSVQHYAAGKAPTDTGAVGLLGHLLRRPVWLLGQALGLLGFTCHALALHHGPIALVQPLIITGIVFAVPLRAAFSRTWPQRTEVAAVVLTAAALAVFLLASDPQRGDARPEGVLFVVMVAASMSTTVVLLSLSRGVRHPIGRAFLLGSGAGLLFGLVAVLIKANQQVAGDDGLLALFATWLPYGLVVVGLSGVAINQLAYRTARLSASMPVLNVVDCLLALGFGYLVFQEVPRHTPISITLSVLGLAAMAVGLWLLAQHEEEPAVAPVAVRA